jgi:hypothetical protein
MYQTEVTILQDLICINAAGHLMIESFNVEVRSDSRAYEGLAVPVCWGRDRGAMHFPELALCSAASAASLHAARLDERLRVKMAIYKSYSVAQLLDELFDLAMSVSTVKGTRKSPY